MNENVINRSFKTLRLQIPLPNIGYCQEHFDINIVTYDQKYRKFTANLFDSLKLLKNQRTERN